MPSIEIRELSKSERLEAIAPLLAYAFRESPSLKNDSEFRNLFETNTDEYYFALFEDGKAVASVVSGILQQNVRGKIYPVSAVWGVAAHPAVRRRGYVRQLMSAMFARKREAGYPFSMLYPFRERFYERLGYTVWPQPRFARFKAKAMQPLQKLDLGGEIMFLPDETGWRHFYACLEQQQRRLHGMGLFRTDNYQRRADENPAWVALAQVDGQTVGAMSYRLTPYGGTFDIWNFYYDTAQARYLMLEWIARHTDQSDDVKIRLAPHEQPETWLADIKVKTESIWPPMGRVLDVSAIGGMHTGPGRFIAQIDDAYCRWNNGRFSFETNDGLLHVMPTQTAPDCTLNSNAIAALIYGTHPVDSFAIRGWGMVPAALQPTLMTMFPRQLPHLHEQF